MISAANLVLVAAAVAATSVISGWVFAYQPWSVGAHGPVPDLVALPPGTFAYRVAGEFTRDGRPVTAPVVTATIERTLVMMRHQVTDADYKRCVEAKACLAVERELGSDYPVVKVSWGDADAYASWLSRETGMLFRLPTDEEWAYAAGSRFNDDAQPDISETTDPGRRALAIYDRDANRETWLEKEPQPVGSFGVNEKGLLDMSGNVWEWTNTCFGRHELAARGDAGSTTVNCGVRVVEGRHRAYMTNFIRDARAGGCSVGIPPSNIGFRLVHDDRPWRELSLLVEWARRLAGG
jgi:formylglycine-generating enzyme required for sulfatase activity